MGLGFTAVCNCDPGQPHASICCVCETTDHTTSEQERGQSTGVQEGCWSGDETVLCSPDANNCITHKPHILLSRGRRAKFFAMAAQLAVHGSWSQTYLRAIRILLFIVVVLRLGLWRRRRRLESLDRMCFASD